MSATPRLIAFRRLAFAGAVLALLVIVLGAFVRLSAAGLGCPDWPGCYGHLTAGDAARNVATVAEAYPDARPFDYAKAVKEMVHRYFAGALGVVILGLAGLALANRRDPRQPVALPLALVAIVVLQALLGMWTVTLLLKPLIVVLHLIGGLTTLALLAWLSMQPPPVSEASAPMLRHLAAIGLAVLAMQIVLGGWTSSNYAALACPDFPTCQASYWPQMDLQDAFVVWRGLGIDYEGGVLDHPARVAIHFMHRLGAVLTAFVLGLLAFLTWRRGRTETVRRAGLVVGIFLVLQLILGPLMVLEGLPLVLATAHNGMAALLLLVTVRLNRVLRPARPAPLPARGPEGTTILPTAGPNA